MINIKKISAILLSFIIFFTLGAVLVYAAQEPATGGTNNPVTGGTNNPATGGTNNPPTGGTNNPTVGVNIKLENPFKGGDSLFALLRTIINDILLPIGGILAVLAFIYSGFLYVTAQGNQTKLDTAHKALLYTSIGTAVLLGSWVLASVICKTIEQIGGQPICPT